MWESLISLQIDGLSFCLGLLVGGIAVWMLSRSRLWLRSKRQSLKLNTQFHQDDALRNDILRLNNDTLLRSQSWHISNALFSLDEIVLEPRLVSPPIAPITNLSNISSDVTDWALPYLPDWPEMASTFGAPTLAIPEALQGGCHLVITGGPGAGKSVALAYLATVLIRQTSGIEAFKNKIPVLLHVGDLQINQGEGSEVLTPIVQALTRIASPESTRQLPDLLPRLFEEGRVIVLLDGLDELPPALFDPLVDYLSRVLSTYSHIRLVVSASSEYYGGLLKLGFFPLALASWSQAKKMEFILRWSKAWKKHIAEKDPDLNEHVDPLLLHGWLANEIIQHNPLELTLRTWAALAGDALGARPQDAIEAFIRRMTLKLAERTRLALEQMALQMVHYMRMTIWQEDAESWLAGAVSAPSDATQELDVHEMQDEGSGGAAKDRIKATGALPGLIETGILVKHAGSRVSLCHPAITGYLAGEGLLRFGGGAQLVLQPDWLGKFLVLDHYCSKQDRIDFIDGLLQKSGSDLLLRDLFHAARWMREAPEGASWTMSVLRQLAACLQKDNLALSLKGKAVAALVAGGKPSVTQLFRQMLTSPKMDLRQLGVLGCGMMRDNNSVTQIIGLMNDQSLQIRVASLLALVAIGNKTSLEAVAEVILHGDESLRKAAAEALSNHPEEGFPALQEGSTHSDPLVRRSSVFGLKRVNQKWAIEILEKLRAEDPQWIVQDAASQALEEIGKLDAHIPTPLPEISQAPWMIAFAAEEKMSVPAGKAALDLMHRSIKKGKEEQTLSSIYYLGFKGEEESIPVLYQVYFNSSGEMHETTLNSLFYLASSGLPLPAPSYYGLG